MHERPLPPLVQTLTDVLKKKHQQTFSETRVNPTAAWPVDAKHRANGTLSDPRTGAETDPSGPRDSQGERAETEDGGTWSTAIRSDLARGLVTRGHMMENK